MIGRNRPAALAPEALIVQFGNGRTLARPAGKPGHRFVPFIGFHVEIGRSRELDDLADRALREYAAALESREGHEPEPPAPGVTRIEMKHQRQGGAQSVEHWSLGPRLELLPITEGPVALNVAQSLSNGRARATANAGIGLRWPDGERSQLALRGYIRALAAIGFTGLAQLGVRGHQTDYLFAALLDHVRAAEAADGLIDRSKHPGPVALAELWLPLEAGDDADVGKRESTTIATIRSGHPAEIGADYLKSIWRTAQIYGLAVGAWPAVKAWALDYQKNGDGAAGDYGVATPAAGELDVDHGQAEGGQTEQPQLLEAPPSGAQLARYDTGGGTGGGRRGRH